MDDLNEIRENTFSSIAEKDRDLTNETLRVLLHYQFERSSGAYSLIINRMVWDAEIILRAVYETSAKVIFIGAHSKSAQVDLIAEFWEVLPAIYDRKGAARARSAEGLRKRYASNDDDIRIFRHLRNPKNFKVEPTGNRTFRNEVEKRWSFSEIVRELDRKSDKHSQVRALDALLHIYGMASHLAHASPRALDLMDDRALRGDDLVHLEAGHICRMLSDLVTLGSFSLRFAEFGLNGSTELVERLNFIIHRMIEVTGEIQTEFARSQDEFYAKHDGHVG